MRAKKKSQARRRKSDKAARAYWSNMSGHRVKSAHVVEDSITGTIEALDIWTTTEQDLTHLKSQQHILGHVWASALHYLLFWLLESYP